MMGRFNQRLNGLNPLAYIGDNSYQPPEFVTYQRAPTSNDSQNFELGTIWLNLANYPTPPTNSDIWMLVALIGGSATWVDFGGGMGDMVSLTTDDMVVVLPLAGNINTFGAHGINTSGTPNTVTVAINNAITLGDLAVLAANANALTITTGDIEVIAGNIKMPVTNTAGTAGVIKFGGNRFISNHENASGLVSTFVGNLSGNTTNTGGGNSGFGSTALSALTTGIVNTALGGAALTSVTSGSANVAVGSAAGNALLTGSFNTLLGAAAGSNYVGAEGSNVLLGNSGVAAETHVMRLGTNGVGPGQVSSTYIAGIAGVTVSNQLDVVIDSVTGQMGTTAGGFGTITGLMTDDGRTVTPTGGVINVLGGTAGRDINTTGTIGPNTVHIDLKNAITLGDLSVIGTGADALTAVTGDISCETGNINLGSTSLDGTRGTITIETTGGGAQIKVFGFPGNNLIMGGNATGTNMTGLCTGNILIGGAYRSITDGQNNNILASQASHSLTTGDRNCFFGYESGNSLTTGDGNVLLGANTGSAYTSSESDNVLLGSGVAGVAGESSVTKIANIRGKTTTNNNAIAVLIDSVGQLGTVSSSARYKENIEDMGSFSDVLYKLRPVSFNYKDYSAESKSVGLIAEEVDEHEPRLVVYDNEGKAETVKYHDLVPMLLNELQKLKKEVEELKRK